MEVHGVVNPNLQMYVRMCFGPRNFTGIDGSVDMQLQKQQLMPLLGKTRLCLE